MAKVWVDEAYGTKVTTTRSGRRKWKRLFVADGVEGFDSYDMEMQAYSLIRSFIADRYPIFSSQRIQQLDITEEIGGGLWRGECTFISPTAAQILQDKNLPDYSFSTKGGNAHITQSRKTVGIYPGYRPEYEYVEDEKGNKSFQVKRDENNKPILIRETAPRLRGLIGWNPEGPPDGVDIMVPSWRSTLKLTVPDEYVDKNYLRMLRWMSCTVNNRPFDGMAPGECLFFGCDGQRKAQEKQQKKDDEEEEGREPEMELVWDLTFEFLGAPNARKWVDGIGWVFKRGWDYSHILRRGISYPLGDAKLPGQPNDIDPPVTGETSENQNNTSDSGGVPGEPEEEEKESVTTSHPVAAYVEQVYPYTDFRVLGFNI